MEGVNYLDEVLAGMKDRITHEERIRLMTRILNLLHELEMALEGRTEFSFDRFCSLVDVIGADYERWQGEFETNSYTFAQRFVAAWSYAEASCVMLAAVNEVDKQDWLFEDLARIAEVETLQMLDVFAPSRHESSDPGMGLAREEWQKLAPAMVQLSEAVVTACIDVDENWEVTDVKRALDEFKTVFDYRTLLDRYVTKRAGKRYQAKPGLLKTVMRLEVAVWLQEKGYDWQMVESCLNGAAGLLSRVYTSGVIQYEHAQRDLYPNLFGIIWSQG